MTVHEIDHKAGTVRHRCNRCGHERHIHLDPRYGDITVFPACFTVSVCPACDGWPDPQTGEPTQVYECLSRDIPAHEAGEGPHAGSMVGYVFPDTGGVVTEHTHGYTLGNQHVEQARAIRAMQRHPHLAKHAPLKDERKDA